MTTDGIGEDAGGAGGTAPLADRAGYDPDFLGPRVPLPRPLPGREGAVLLLPDGGTELRYRTFGVLMHARRRLALVAAGNADPRLRRDVPRLGGFRYDPRIPREAQAGDRFYRANPLDRGHLFRRADGAWGRDRAAAREASDDTFHWPNVAPQHEVFNQAGRDPVFSLWGLLETHVAGEAGDGRYSVLAGPVFQGGDPVHRGLAVPQSYFKVVALAPGGALEAVAFVVGQASLLRDLEPEGFAPGRFGVFQLRVRDLEPRIGLDLGAALRAADALEAPARGVRPEARARLVEGPGDIVRRVGPG